MHKSGAGSDPAKWDRELHQFFDWLESEIRSDEPIRHDFAGDKNTRRKITRTVRSAIKGLVNAYPHAPALQALIAASLDALSHLNDDNNSTVVKGPLGDMRLWKGERGLRHAVSVDLDRRTRERKTELLYVAWKVAPFIDADEGYDSIRKHLPLRGSCDDKRSIYERHRRLRKRLKKGGFAALIENYFEEFKLARFHKAHPRTMYPMLEYPTRTQSVRITALTKDEIDSISKLCRRWRRKLRNASASPAPQQASRPRVVPPAYGQHPGLGASSRSTPL